MRSDTSSTTVTSTTPNGTAPSGNMNGDWLMKHVPAYEYRHPLLFARVRVGVGAWLLILTAILYGYGRGGWWGVLLLPAAALLFYVAYRLPRAIRARNPRDAK